MTDNQNGITPYHHEAETSRKATTMAFRVEAERQPLVVRLPHDIKAWLESEALRNGGSQSSEVVRILRARLDNEQPKKATG